MHKLTTVQEVYDRLGLEYFFSPAHQTTKCFNYLQSIAIHKAVQRWAQSYARDLYHLDVLNIGIGNGQLWPLGGLTSYKPKINAIDGNVNVIMSSEQLQARNRLNWSRIVDLDLSSAMLQIAYLWYPPKDWLQAVGEHQPQRVQGKAPHLPFASDSFDLVFAALCDHIQNQEALYEAVRRVLKPEGLFLATYPHGETMKVSRKRIYGIDPAFTKFQVGAVNYLLPSFAPRPKEVWELFEGNGFAEVEVSTFYYPAQWAAIHFSNTLKQAAQLMGVDLAKLPLLILGTGSKQL